MKEERQSNFELMRIVATFFIVMWHVLVHGMLLEDIGEPFAFISKVLCSIMIVHVNSLIFLTGYFSCEKKEVKQKKVLKLLGEGWFYKVLIFLIIFLTGILSFTKIEIFHELSPLDFRHYWFLNCYAVLYLLAPYINKVTNKMSEIEFKKLLGIIILLLCILPMISNQTFIENDGYSIIHFIIIYLFGSFCRKYPIKDSIHFQNISKKKWNLLLVCTFLFTALVRLSLFYLGSKMKTINSVVLAEWGILLQKDFYSYASPLVIFQTCVFCLYFENLELKKNKLINYIASTSLGIYLIHDNANIRKGLGHIKDYIKITDKRVFLVLIGVSIGIFIASFLIESIRKLFVKIITSICQLFRKRKEKIKKKQS